MSCCHTLVHDCFEANNLEGAHFDELGFGRNVNGISDIDTITCMMRDARCEKYDAIQGRWCSLSSIVISIGIMNNFELHAKMKLFTRRHAHESR